jgi:predicted nucleotidyltransferase component of viral defense system
MTSITRRDVIYHQHHVPWQDPRQVEQDLLLSQAMVALFSDAFLKTQIAMRGGTLLHKVHLAPPARYSEDIDLVAIGDRPEEHIDKAIRRVLKDCLGKPSKSIWDSIALSVRNVVRPSRVLRLTYLIASQSTPGGRPLEIVIEVNVTERTPHRRIVVLPFSYPFQGQSVLVELNGFDLDEMLGTKLRALFQRRRGRDLFDLYWALSQSKTGSHPKRIIDSFQHYLKKEGTIAHRKEFIDLLNGHLKDPGFLTDMDPLLRSGIEYDPHVAAKLVISCLLNLLPTK